MVADGMGGANAGHIAAKLAVDQVTTYLQLVDEERTIEIKDLSSALAEANHKVFDTAARLEKFHGMGTTIVLAMNFEQDLTFCHAGDSRAYLFRNGILSQVTKDHSVTQDWIEQGRMSEKEARVSAHRSVLTKAIGMEHFVDPEMTVLRKEPDDMLLLCTDGLSDVVSDKEISAILVAHKDHHANALLSLIQAADRLGSRDNITALIADNLG